MAPGDDPQRGDSGRGAGDTSTAPAFGDFLRSVQLGVAAVREGRAPPPYSGQPRREGRTNELIVLVDTVLDELGVVLARLQQVESISRSDAVLLLRERAAGLEATIKDLSERPGEEALLDAVDAVASRLESFEARIDAVEGRVESNIDARTRETGTRIDVLEEKILSIGTGVNDTAADLYQAVEQLLAQRLEDTARSTLPRLDALDEQVSAVNTGIGETLTEMYQAIEQLLAQRLEATAQTTVPRLDLLQERLGAVTTTVQENSAQLFQAFETLLQARLAESAQASAARADALQGSLKADTAALAGANDERLTALHEALTADTAARFEALAGATDERIAALESSVEASTTSLVEALQETLDNAGSARFEGLAERLESTEAARVERSEAQIEAITGTLRNTLAALPPAIDRAIGQRLEHNVEALGPRFEALEERLSALTSYMEGMSDGLLPAFETLVAQRLDAFQERLAATDELTRHQAADGLEAGQQAIARTGDRLTEQVEGLAEANRRLYQQLGRRVVGELTAQRELLTTQGGSLTAQADLLGSHREDLASHRDALDSQAAVLMALGTTLGSLAEQIHARFETIESGLALDRDDANQRLETLNQTLADNVRAVEAASTISERRLEAIRNDLVGATTGLAESLTARSDADANRTAQVRQQLQLIEDAMNRFSAQTGERLGVDSRSIVAAIDRSAAALHQSVMSVVAAGIENLRTQMLERSGPEAAMPELLLAFGEAQEQAVTQALSQLGEGALRDFGHDLARVERITRELIGRNDATVSVLDIVKLESQEMASVVQEMANRVESSQAQVDGVRDSLANIFESVERLRGGQTELGSAFTQLRTNSLQREDASSFMSQLAAVNAELLRHRGWLEDMSSHLHAINDSMAGLQAWTQRGAATFGKPADLGPTAEPGRF